MTREQIQKSVLLYLYWLGFITAALIVVLTDLLPMRAAFVSPEDLFLCLVEAEIFFVLAIWPLFIPTILRIQDARPERDARSPVLFLQVCVLVLFSSPLALVCQSVSNAGPAAFLTAQLLVAALAVFVAALFNAAHRMRARIGAWYYLVFFLASTALPFLSFLLREHGGPTPEFLAFLSPFWAAMHPGPALVHSAMFGTIAVILIASAPALHRRVLDSPSAAG